MPTRTRKWFERAAPDDAAAQPRIDVSLRSVALVILAFGGAMALLH